MTDNIIWGAIRVAAAKHLGVEVDQVGRDTTPEELDADSLDRVELVMEYENLFAIAISDDEADQAKTFGDFFTMIEAKVAVKAAAA